MPLTRSMKDELRAASQQAEEAITRRTQETSEHAATDSSRTKTPESTATNINVSRDTGEDRLIKLTAEKKLTERKNLIKSLQEQEAQKNSSIRTVVPEGSVRAKSFRSTSSAARLRKLEAEEEMLQIQLKLARIRLEKQQIMDDEEDNLEEEPALEDRSSQVQKWIQTSPLTEVKDDIPGQLFQDSQATQPGVKIEHPATSTTQAFIIADAIKQAFESHTFSAQRTSQHQLYQELPYYDGNSSEWVAFRVVYDDTSKSYTPTQNMTRLRRAIKGAARSTFKSLLYSDATPDQVMKALQRRYGRPDSLVMQELDRIKALPKIGENPQEICSFASDVDNCVTAIHGLQKPQYLCSPVMVREIVEKLPSYLKFQWYDYADAKEDQEPADLTLMAKFLNKQADRCGAYALLEKKKQPRGREMTHIVTEDEEDEGRRPLSAKNGSKKWNCINCQGNHYLTDCPLFLKKSVEERWKLVVSHRICFKYLQGRHRKDHCKKPPCKTCKYPHHSLLHSERRNPEQKNEASNSTNVFNEVDAEQAMTTSITLPVHAMRTTRAYLKIVPVEIYGPTGSQKVLALLDEGSTVSLLDSQIAKSIGAKGTEEELVIESIGGKLIRKINSERLNICIRGVHQQEKKNLHRVRTIDEMNLAPQFIDKERIEQCSHLKQIATVLYYEFEPPRLLIGQDNWELIISQDIKRGKPGQPVASLTELGWVLHGSDKRNVKPVHFINKCMHVKTMEDKIHDTMKEHFAIESLGVQPRRPTTDSDGRALAILEQTCRRRPDGRFEVGLLWKNKDDQMPDSYKSAEKRLISIERKMDKDPNLKEEYKRQIQHLLDENYAEEATNEHNSARKWYLPHFSVVHPLKKKVRIVFDAAAKSQGKSLNDALLPGPDLLQPLFGVLTRFRQGPIAVAADIKEMFLQIKIIPEDRDSLRFLWRKGNQDTSPKEYRMNTVIFGATSSPSTAIFVKNRNAEDFKNQYPDAVLAIERNHYMDDYLHSFHSEKQLVKIASEVDFIHKKAGFELRGWASNRSYLLQKVTNEGAEKTEIELSNKEEKTLGLRWFTKEDTIGFRANLRNTPEEVLLKKRIPTKREVTSAVMSTFDPLGLASPVLIQGQKLLQSIWRSGISWDGEIEEKDHETWQTYIKNIQLLKTLNIPRCIAPHSTDGELHVFTDASETAYAAVAYWRTTNENSDFHVNLIAGKARVTPLKPVSIPRLELQAALLGSRLADSLTRELDLKINKKTYWTDSSIVLSWIKSDPRTYKTFVAHRLAEIEDLTHPQEWRWVSTLNNPADDGTRDVPENFSRSHRWFTGPDFLKLEERCWPEKRIFKEKNTGEEKEKIFTASVNDKYEYTSPDPERFSSWKRLWRTMARVLQFISLCKTKDKVNISRQLKKIDPTWKKSKKSVTRKIRNLCKEGTTKRMFLQIEPELLEQAEILLLKRSQTESFKEDFHYLERGKKLPNNSKLKKLDVEVNNGLLRLRGRVNAIKGVSEEFKRPIVLHSKNKITNLIIEDCHRRFNHGNHATVMNELRQRFLILGLRSAVRSTLHHCQWCKTYRSKPQKLPIGDLPPERLRHGAPPFTCCAVDYFGPMNVTLGRRHEKRWGALFTCLTTRAVHIELVTSLTTSSMIMALRRFAARRGMPKILYSDNGTNFVGANKELKEAIEEMKKGKLVTETEELGIKWKFIPPGAPNMGGAWERLVQSIKTALGVTLKEKTPKEETLHTLLLEAEHIVNSRPLTNAADNPDEEALTPNHFLIGRSNGAARIGAFTDKELVGRETWKTAQQLADHFWRRWLREYLPTLLPRKIGGRLEHTNLNVGDIVLIVDSSLPRCTWPRGKVLKIYPGPDGKTRVADIETRGGVLRRPNSRLVVLVTSPNLKNGATHGGETVGD
ncbi:jg24405 [Pararge aegeria aegeria]|uniref:Jg24405 protein n=1 Tax=Pararge aegeria aegeria TaxID=348720 RepID=A0A8S4QYD7_9NEOP|nr:jg24405 [Pararge aegeria aegeria]